MHVFSLSIFLSPISLSISLSICLVIEPRYCTAMHNYRQYLYSRFTVFNCPASDEIFAKCYFCIQISRRHLALSSESYSERYSERQQERESERERVRMFYARKQRSHKSSTRSSCHLSLLSLSRYLTHFLSAPSLAFSLILLSHSALSLSFCSHPLSDCHSLTVVVPMVTLSLTSGP